MRVEKVVSKEKANYPFLVQVKNTENWNTTNAYPSDCEAQAWCRAEGLAHAYPKLPVRVVHCVGGPFVSGK